MDRIGRCLLALVVLAMLAFLQCRPAPTTVLLRIEAEVGLSQLEELRLTVFGAGGVEVKDRRVPDTGRPVLPGEVVLYPRQPGQLRLLVRAVASAAQAGDGAVSVEAAAGQQTRATVVLKAGALADRDGDGVPDAIDNCPDIPNPDQRPCQPDAHVADARLDMPGDGPRPDTARPDQLAPDLLDCDKDKDGYRALACGSNDCNDSDPKVNPGQTEGPPGAATCSDGVDNDCDGAKDLADTNCHSCTDPSECDDKNVCTADSCTGGVCKNGAANDGLICDDSNACTTGTTCKGGLCSGGQPLSCPTLDACKPASCDPAKGCTSQSLPDGTKCDDGKFCNEGEACTGGVCGGGKARDCSTGAPQCKVGACDESSDSCVYSPVSGSPTCDDGNSCTQGETCAGGVCTPPPLLLDTVESQGIDDGTDRSTRVDSKGAVHTAYHTMNGDALRYATNASGTWQTEQVPNGSGHYGDYPALALDGQGQVHVVYLDRNKNQITHATKTGTGWQTDTIDNGGGYTSIAFDGAGTAYVSYKKYEDLWFAVRTAGGNWNKNNVDSAVAPEEVGYNSSLAIDPQGKLHIAHTRGHETGGGDVVPVALRYSTNASGSWVSSGPATTIGDHGGFPSIAVGTSGQIYITHTTNTVYSTAGGTLYVTSRVGGTWKTETLSTPAEVGNFSSVLLDSGGKVHIAYRHPLGTSSSELRYATNVSGSFVIKTLDATIGQTTAFCSMAQAASGTLHVVYKVQGSGTSSPLVRHLAFSACP